MQQAFILRIAPSNIDRVPEALNEDQVIIGWANAAGLLDDSLNWEQFRAILSDNIYHSEPNLRRAGAASGHMWRFIREMNIGDFVVVPYGSEFYIAEVTGPATFNPDKVDDDTAYRRKVKWLNSKNPIKRTIAKAALISRMKTYGTCAYASDLIEEIKDALNVSRLGQTPTFHGDLQKRLIRETLDEMRNGRIEDYGFEKLIRSVLYRLGAVEAKIIPRNLDKGADVVASFRVAGTIIQTIAVQAKHWQPEPQVGKDVVLQLINGIEAESADLGMIVTTGTASEEAIAVAKEYYETKGIKIEFVDGEQLAKLIVENGIVAEQSVP